MRFFPVGSGIETRMLRPLTDESSNISHVRKRLVSDWSAASEWNEHPFPSSQSWSRPQIRRTVILSEPMRKSCPARNITTSAGDVNRRDLNIHSFQNRVCLWISTVAVSAPVSVT